MQSSFGGDDGAIAPAMYEKSSPQGGDRSPDERSDIREQRLRSDPRVPHLALMSSVKVGGAASLSAAVFCGGWGLDDRATVGTRP